MQHIESVNMNKHVFIPFLTIQYINVNGRGSWDVRERHGMLIGLPVVPNISGQARNVIPGPELGYLGTLFVLKFYVLS